MTPQRLVGSMLRVEPVALSRGALDRWGKLGFSAILDVSGVDLGAVHSAFRLHGYTLLDGSGFDDFPPIGREEVFRKVTPLGQRRALMRTVRVCLDTVEAGLPTMVVDRAGATRAHIVAAGALVHLVGCSPEEALTAVDASSTPVQIAAVGWVQEQQR